MKKLFAIFTAAFVLLANINAYAQTESYIPKNAAKALVIIHGYGGTGNTLSWMTEHLKDKFPDTAFYYPTAPDKAPVGGYQWFVIPTLGEEMSQKALYDKMMADAVNNVAELHDLVDEIHHSQNIPYQNITISGFSQGGLMALLTVLTNPHHLSAAVSFSGVPLLFTPDFTEDLVKNTADILLIQGDKDNIIPKNSIEMSKETLEKLKITPEIKIISGMTHRIGHEAIDYLTVFLER